MRDIMGGTDEGGLSTAAVRGMRKAWRAASGGGALLLPQVL